VKLLVGSLYFEPDHSGIAVYANDLAVYLAEQGHDVTVVTGFPFYPQWKKRAEDRGRLMATDWWKGIRILRSYVYVPPVVNTVTRVLHELSFALSVFFGLLRAGRQDAIIVLSPPLLLAAAAVPFKYLWNARLVSHIQDLQPDAALSLNMIRSGVIGRALLALEAFVYRHSDLVVTISAGMHQRILAKKVPAERLAMFPNWIDVDAHAAPRARGAFRGRYPQLAGRFLVAYAGNVGVKQGLDVLVRAAAEARPREDVHFLIIGDGADMPRIREMADALALTNLTLLPFMDTSEYFDMLADVDVSFIAQRPGVGEVFFPSKLLGIMAAGRASIVAADANSELAHVVAAGDAGVVVGPDDAGAVARAAVRLAADPERLREMEAGARRTVGRYDRNTVLAGLLAEISNEAPAPVGACVN
jgi:colanic acid biosynthesis glycosyl transferase WcaI